MARMLDDLGVVPLDANGQGKAAVNSEWIATQTAQAFALKTCLACFQEVGLPGMDGDF